MYILSLEKYNTIAFSILTWYQSHYFDLFLTVLSLLVLLHFQHRFRRHNSCCSLLLLILQRLPKVVFGFRTCSRCRWGVLHHTNPCRCHYCREYCSDYVSVGITKIVLRQSTRWWKPRSHWRYHAPSLATQIFCAQAHTFLALTAFFTRLHALACARFAPVDVSPRWCHHCHVIC